MNPNEALLQQGVALIKADRPAEVEALIRPYLAAGTGPIPLWHLLAQAVRLQGRIDEAVVIQQMIADHLPGNMSVRFDLAESLLLTGEFTRGWREYRFRYQQPHTQVLGRRVQQPRWNGQPLTGKTLLIHDEQGFGDTFQFMRLVAWVRARYEGRVVFEVNVESLGLAQRFLGRDVIAKGSLPPPFDYHCELMSLPQVLNLQLSDLPGSVAYLNAAPERLEKWRKRLADLPRPLVGLVWAGRPSHSNDHRRSLQLADLAPLAQPGITFVTLQKGPASAQAAQPPAGMNLLALSDEINDFEDTAALMTVLDLTISVDSGPAHLAGALGRPTWVMLAFVPCWRWLLARSDSPWYPNTRLFRQPAAGQWQPMLASMGEQLAQWSATAP